MCEWISVFDELPAEDFTQVVGIIKWDGLERCAVLWYAEERFFLMGTWFEQHPNFWMPVPEKPTDD